MTIRKVALLLSSLAIAFATSGATCGGEDDCVSAKKHMCENIPDMGCSALFMDNAQQKIVDACGQAELSAYIPAVQAACDASQASGVPMSCDAIAGKSYAGPQSGGGGCGTGAPMTFGYSGIATADGRAAQLTFSISGTTVTGTLYATGTCATNIRLTTTNIAFSGVLSGPWESASGSISATWSGGDSVCGTQLTEVDGYPTSGSLVISMVGSRVQLQRLIGNAEPYEFAPTGAKYTPSAACPDSGIGRDATNAGSDARATNDALGPVCSKLAQCCPTITDIPALQSQCYTALGNGLGDSGCQIALNDFTHIGYCTDL